MAATTAESGPAEDTAKSGPAEDTAKSGSAHGIIAKNILDCSTSKSCTTSSSCTIFRAGIRKKRLHASYYDGELISLGLYKYNRYQPKTAGDSQCQIEYDPKISPLTALERVEHFRFEIVSAFLADLKATDERQLTWPVVCEKVTNEPKKMLALYSQSGIEVSDRVPKDELQSKLKDIQSILTLDAMFLTCFILCSVRIDSFGMQFPLVVKSFRKESSSTIGIIREDVIKMENQIPLCLLIKVIKLAMKSGKRFDKIYEEGNHSKPAGRMLDHIRKEVLKLISTVISKSSYHPCIPGFNTGLKPVDQVEFDTCHHLLHCLYVASTEPPLRPDANRSDPNRQIWNWCRFWPCYPPPGIQDSCVLPTATQLANGGIEFRAEKGGSSRAVRFEKHMFTAILHLPVIEYLGRDTERIWRNLVAYEDERPREPVDERSGESVHERPGGRNDFRAYLQLMDELIDTEEDVAVLKSGNSPVIIRTGLGSDKNVADLFNSMITENLQPLPPWTEWEDLRNDIREFYNNKRRRGWVEFTNRYFGKWWLTVSLFAAAFLLVLTVIQTTYILITYYDPP